MKPRFLSEQNAIEFETIGREHDAVEIEIKAIMAKKHADIGDDDFARIHALLEQQASLHARRMNLFR